VDHLGRAEELRQRAAKCKAAAQRTTSSEFRTCYDLLATNYLIQARLEEDYAEGTERIASRNASTGTKGSLRTIPASK
jgi:hypothetical protein